MKTMLFILLVGGLAAALIALAAEPDNTLTREEKAAGWRLLFDGRSLDGWKASNPAIFSVQDGQIIAKGEESYLYYFGDIQNHDFTNFELKADVLTFPGANSGIFFHTHWRPAGSPGGGFEDQIDNSHPDPKRTASLYAVKDNYADVAKDGEWFTMGLRVEGKHVVTTVNGRVIIDWTQPDNWVPPKGLPDRVLSHGTFALQGHPGGAETHFRNIKIRVLPPS